MRQERRISGSRSKRRSMRGSSNSGSWLSSSHSHSNDSDSLGDWMHLTKDQKDLAGRNEEEIIAISNSCIV